MTWKEHTKQNFHIAFPIMLSQMGQIILGIADTAMVGKVSDPKQSEINLGAASLGNTIFVLLFVIALGVSIIMSPLVAEKNAQNDTEGIKNIFKHSLIINVSLGVLMAIIGVCSTPLLYYLEQPKVVIDNAIPYLNWIAISLIPLLLFQSFRQLGEGINIIIPATISIWLALPINIFLNYCWIYGNFGFEKMGVTGAALGTFCARVASVFIIYIIYKNSSKLNSLITKINWKTYSNKLFIQLIKLGIPTSLQMFFELSAFTVAAFIAGYYTKKYNSADLAAHQVALQLASTSFMICIGFAAAATIRVGHSYGLRNQKLIRETGFSAIHLAAMFMFSCGVIFIVFRHQLPYFFTDSLNAANLASQLLIITAFFQLGDGIQLVSMGALRGLQDVTRPMIVTFFAYWVIAIPLSLLCGIYYKMGAFGIWIGLGVGLSFSGATLLYRFHKLSKIKMEKYTTKEHL